MHSVVCESPADSLLTHVSGNVCWFFQGGKQNPNIQVSGKNVIEMMPSLKKNL